MAFFGGSFDPPHWAHVFGCVWALGSGEVDRVWVVPCFRHALAKSLTPFDQRLAMCELAFRGLPWPVEVTDVEGRLGGTSRTLDTLRHLEARHPDVSFRLLAGQDVCRERRMWHRFEEIERMAPPLLMGRVGFEGSEEAGEGAMGEPVLPDVSSSRIRDLLATGQEWRHLVPAAVARYMEEHAVYPGLDG